MASRRVLVAGSMIISAVLATSACSSAAPGKNRTAQMTVVTSSYPLQFAAEQIGGDHVAVTSLTKPGAKAHDIELTTRDVATVSKAGLVIYEKGLPGGGGQCGRIAGRRASPERRPGGRPSMTNP